jgi:hypothetical protein
MFGEEELRQLHQWQLWCAERGVSSALPDSLRRRCYDAFSKGDASPSKLQRDVVRALEALGLQPREEVRTPSGYSVDAMVAVEGREVAVEVDGPSHFVGRSPTGATRMKRRQLVALEGCALVSVPYWEWDALRQSGGAEEYLRQALRKATSGEGAIAAAHKQAAQVAESAPVDAARPMGKRPRGRPRRGVS